jgi:hypothetical protein
MKKSEFLGKWEIRFVSIDQFGLKSYRHKNK